jgi:hypothetical protein
VVKLWYPYISNQECQSLICAAPSSHTPKGESINYEQTWHEEDMVAMQHEFEAMDASGDSTVDRYV